MSEQENKEVVEQEQGTNKVVPLALSAKVRVNGRLLQTDLNPEVIYKEWPEFGPGDTVKVHYKIKEGDKERVQPYEGVVISVRGEGLGKTFMVRRISHEVGVERVFPYHSPAIANLEVVRRGLVRRSKLFYLRYKSGKESRIKESFEGKDKAVAEKKKAQAKERARKAKAQKEG